MEREGHLKMGSVRTWETESRTMEQIWFLDFLSLTKHLFHPKCVLDMVLNVHKF